MSNIHFFDSASNPKLEAYQNLKDAGRLKREGRFITEGRYVTERLLLSDYDTESLLISENRVESFRDDLQCDVPSDVPVYVLPEKEIEELVGFQFHRGILGCGKRGLNLDIENILPSSEEPLLLSICPDVGQAENLGQIIRSSRAFGVDALILGESCCDPFSRRALRVSMGNALYLPIYTSSNIAHDLAHLKVDWGIELVGTTLDEEALSLPETQFHSRVGLIFGNESKGMRQEVKDLCDHLVTIPMQTGMDSLNVGVAAGIFLYQVANEKVVEIPE